MHPTSPCLHTDTTYGTHMLATCHSLLHGTRPRSHNQQSDDGYGGNGFACVLPDRPEEYEATWGVGLCGWTSGGTYVSSVWAQMPNGTQVRGWGTDR